jgi:hypothetical protein
MNLAAVARLVFLIDAAGTIVWRGMGYGPEL